MPRRLDNRAAHWLLLAAAWAVLCLPGLGRPALWDIDEGNNAEAAREMFESGDWVVPAFNFKTRYDKPALLYWLQAAAYAGFGVNEFAARVPSALAALLTVLLTYEIGRSLLGRGAGLLGGLVLVTSIAFCASAHFANPDALLDLCTALALFAFWQDYRGRGRAWAALTGAATGLGMLAKGPVGLVLPVAASVLFLAWRRRLGFFADVRRLALSALSFGVVAAPWYIWVAAETKGEWLYNFWVRHHFDRMTTALEHHQGPWWYYAAVLVGGLAPWSAFLGPTAWLAWRGARRGPGEESPDRPAFQLLACWFAVYLVFFSLVRTKLPNYVLPCYPAVAVLVGCLLARWQAGELTLPAWVMPVALACVALMGMGLAGGLLVAGGVVPLRALRGRYVPGVEAGAVLALAWVLGAAAAAWCLRRGSRGGMVSALTVAAVTFTAGAASWGTLLADQHKAVRPLVAALPADQLRREVRVAVFDYFQPSLVFYCRREVRRIWYEPQLWDFLGAPLPGYVFLPAALWEQLAPRAPAGCRLVARHYDLYDGHDAVLITNEGTGYRLQGTAEGP
jgi:4-amino-4-deoxy-L-arabinose transferase-like glycosyltransferase